MEARTLLLSLLIWLVAGCAALERQPVDYPPAHDLDQRQVIAAEIDAAFKRSEWDKKERLAFTLSVIGHGLDLASSLTSDERCVERNPLLGESPSDGALVAVKLAAIGFEWWLYNSPRFDKQPVYWYGFTSAIIHGATAAKNFTNDCY